MRGQVRTVMLPEDERELVRIIASETGTVLVGGPKWDTPEPPIVSRLEESGEYLIIWNLLRAPISDSETL